MTKRNTLIKIFQTSLLTILTIQLYSQTAAVMPDQMNVFYKGCFNPITVVLENCSCKDIVVKTSVGEISGKGCHYNIWGFDSASHIDKVYVGILKNDVVYWIDSLYFRLKIVPDPIPYLYGLNYGLKGGMIDKELLCDADGILPKIDGFETSFMITSYSVEISRKDSVMFKSDIIGGRFTPLLIEFIMGYCSSNDDVKFYNIMARGKDGLHRKLNEMRFKLK